MRGTRLLFAVGLAVSLVAVLAPKADAQAVQGYVYTTELSSAAVRTDLKRGLLSHAVVHGTYAGATGALTGFNPASVSVADFVNFAHANHVKVLLSIINFNSTTTKTLLDSYQSACISNILAQVHAAHMDGCSVDFENVSDALAYRNKFSAFVTALSAAAHAQHLEVYVAVHQQVYPRYNGAALAAAADGLFVMGYGFHWSGSTVAGPNAPLTTGGYWSLAYENRIFSKTHPNSWRAYVVNPRKLILGMPLYGRKWKTLSAGVGASTVAGTSSALRFKQDIFGSFGKIWDPKSKTPYYTWTASGSYYQLWYDDAESMGLKMTAAADNDLGGIGFWKLPWATEGIWGKVADYTNAYSMIDYFPPPNERPRPGAAPMPIGPPPPSPAGP